MADKIVVVLESNGGTYRAEMVQSARATREFGDSADKAERSASGLAGSQAKASKETSYLGSLVKEAGATFLGFVSAQAVIGGVQTAVGDLKSELFDFDKALTNSLSIAGDVTVEQTDRMKQGARDLAVEWNMSSQDTAGAYYYLISAGYDLESSIKGLEPVTAFAKAGMFDLEEATTLAADAQAAMGLKSADASENLTQLTRVTDVLTKGSILANANVEQLSSALTNKAASASRLAGVSLEETVAVLSAFADQGIKGKKAGEAYAIVLRNLQEKARENKDEFKALGVEVYTAEGNLRSWPEIIRDIEGALQGQTVAQQDALLATLGMDAEGKAYLKTLIGTSDKVEEYTGKLREAGGTTKEVAEKQMTALSERIGQLKQRLVTLGVEGLEATAGKAMELGKWIGENTSLVVVLGGALVGRLLPPLARSVSEFTTMIAMKVYDWFALASAQAGSFGDRLRAASAAGGSFGGSLKNIASMALSSNAALMLASAGLAAELDAIHGYEQAAKELADSTAGEVTKNNLDKMAESAARLRVQTDALSGKYRGEYRSGIVAFGSSMADLLIPFHDVTDSALDQTSKLNGVKDKWAEVTNAEVEAHNKLMVIAQAMAEQEGTVASGGVGVWLDRLKASAANMDVDLTQPLAAWSKEVVNATLAAQNGTPATDTLAGSLETVADEASSATDELDAYKDAIDALLGVHISEFEANTKLGQSFDALSKSLVENGLTMDAGTEKGRANRDAFAAAAQAALDHATAVAQESGDISKGNETLFAHTVQLYNVMRAYGYTDEQAKNYLATLGLTPDTLQTLVSLQGADTAGAKLGELQGQLTTIDNSTTTAKVDADTTQAKIRIQELQQQAITVITRIVTGNADGAVYARSFADGGHYAQIAGPGAWRVWAEPETGGEAYIPLASSKRERSLSILGQVATMFGYGLMPMANGGILGGLTVAPGAVTVSIGSAGSGVDVEAAVARATRGLVRSLHKETRANRTRSVGR